jgi:hypothetical protein
MFIGALFPTYRNESFSFLLEFESSHLSQLLQKIVRKDIGKYLTPSAVDPDASGLTAVLIELKKLTGRENR